MSGILLGVVAAAGLVLGVAHTTGMEPPATQPSSMTLPDADAVPAVLDSPAPSAATTPTASPEPEWVPDAVDVSALPPADTWAIMPQAPVDDAQDQIPSGDVATPNREPGVPLYTSPDHGEAFAYLPTVQYIGNSSYPILRATPTWLQVMITPRHGIPSEVGGDHVNGTTGWVLRSDVTISHIPYVVTADLSTETITILKDGSPVLTSVMAIGKPTSPSPVTRTFIMSTYHDASATYSPMMVALGSHSPAFDTYLGGPAPTAIHTYTNGRWVGQISNGCLRVPSDVFDQFTALPLGTPVVIWAKKPVLPDVPTWAFWLDDAVA